MIIPELRPGFAWWPAYEDVRVVLALFVLDAFGVSVMAGKPATRKY